MRALKTLLMLGGIVPFAAVAFAQSESTPEEQQQTQDLNQDQMNRAAQSDAQYNDQQQQYEQQQQQYQSERQRYDEQAQRYESARDRYAAERASYRRGEWREPYTEVKYVDGSDLIGMRVETYSGGRAGRVDDFALTPDNELDAVRVALDDGESHVWIDHNDLKYDTGDRLLVTDLARHDLYSMAREQY